jgi:hypothetical protein
MHEDEVEMYHLPRRQQPGMRAYNEAPPQRRLPPQQHLFEDDLHGAGQINYSSSIHLPQQRFGDKYYG